MKNTFLALLGITLIITLLNLLASLGLLGTGGGSVEYEYKALNGAQMDSIGFRSIAEEEGIEISEEGEIQFPNEMADQLLKPNLLPREIMEVESDGGWEFVAVTADSVYIFRRPR